MRWCETLAGIINIPWGRICGRCQRGALGTVIIRANSQREKLPVLYALCERVEALEVLLRICKEVKAFSKFEAYAHAAQLAVALGRPNEGWLKSQASLSRPKMIVHKYRFEMSPFHQ